MTSAPKTKTDWLNLPKADEHPLLADLTAQMSGAQIRDDVESYGHKYTLETLWPHEEAWADGYVVGVNFYQTGRNRRLPYIAASLRAIDGVPVSQLFKLPASTPEEMRTEFESNPRALDGWRRDQLFQRLGGEKPMLPPQVISELWTFYQELEDRRKEALGKIGPLSKSGVGGGSSPTSSPAKVS